MRRGWTLYVVLSLLLIHSGFTTLRMVRLQTALNHALDLVNQEAKEIGMLRETVELQHKTIELLHKTIDLQRQIQGRAGIPWGRQAPDNENETPHARL